MKFFLLLACLALYVAHIQAQRFCVGRPVNQVCTGGRDIGHNRNSACRNFAMREMWYYDARRRSCVKMNYLGCGGNGNRYCSNADCLAKCRR
ncbi:male accessory gland serine protease inhibitor-like [Drosophila montana]|uniref:male accessory gland serine protease inhibitor-like n=1 Tax=Drosophila montana TaxID=40370 RepID=UPI00313ED050